MSRKKRVRGGTPPPTKRYLGTWVLPSGNSCDVYLNLPLPAAGAVAMAGLTCAWDREPSPAWPSADIAHWHDVTFPEIVRAIANETGQNVAGVRL